MKYYAISREDLERLGVKDFSEYDSSQICIWWDKETVMDIVKGDNKGVDEDKIKEAVDGIFEDLCFIDSSDVNREIELQSSNAIKKLLGE